MNRPGALGQLATAIGQAGGNIGAIDGVEVVGDIRRTCGTGVVT